MTALGLSLGLPFKSAYSSSAPQPEISQFDFSGVSVASLASTGAAKYLTAGDTSGNAHYFWFKSALETDPNPGGIGHRIDFSLGDEIEQIAAALISTAEATTLWAGELVDAAAILTMAANGAVTNATPGTSGVTVTILQQGS